MVTLGHSTVTTYAEFTRRLIERFDRRDPEQHFVGFECNNPDFQFRGWIYLQWPQFPGFQVMFGCNGRFPGLCNIQVYFCSPLGELGAVFLKLAPKIEESRWKTLLKIRKVRRAASYFGFYGSSLA